MASYQIGYSVPRAIKGILPSTSPSQTGALIGYNSYTENGDPSFFTENCLTWLDGGYQRIAGRPLVQVNPLTWIDGDGSMTALANPGSLPVAGPDAASGNLVSGLVGASASGQVLRITQPPVTSFPGGGTGIPFLESDFGDYHNYDYQLFYESIRGNALERVQAFTK